MFDDGDDSQTSQVLASVCRVGCDTVGGRSVLHAGVDVIDAGHGDRYLTGMLALFFSVLCVPGPGKRQVLLYWFMLYLHHHPLPPPLFYTHIYIRQGLIVNTSDCCGSPLGHQSQRVCKRLPALAPLAPTQSTIRRAACLAPTCLPFASPCRLRG